MNSLEKKYQRPLKRNRRVRKTVKRSLGIIRVHGMLSFCHNRHCDSDYEAIVFVLRCLQHIVFFTAVSGEFTNALVAWWLRHAEIFEARYLKHTIRAATIATTSLCELLILEYSTSGKFAVALCKDRRNHSLDCSSSVMQSSAVVGVQTMSVNYF